MNLTQNLEMIWPKLKEGTDLGTVGAAGTGSLEKVLAMTILGIGSFLSGMLPAIISERNRLRLPLTTSLMLMFGAGILLATALVHILPEVRKQMNNNWAEISLCGGFFAIYFIDEFIHYFFGEVQHSDETTIIENNGTVSHNYGALHTNSNESDPLVHHEQLPHATTDSSDNDLHQNHQHCNGDMAADRPTHSKPCTKTTTSKLALFVALSLHSAIEGLAIGVQNTSTKVLFLLGAVACHKFVMGFCLGLELRSDSQTKVKSQLIAISIFALGAVIGIGIGMLLVDTPSPMSIQLPIIQGLAGGSLLYVTTCEILPREKSKWHQNPIRKAAGFYQYLTVAFGFTTMTVITMNLDALSNSVGQEWIDVIISDAFPVLDFWENGHFANAYTTLCGAKPTVCRSYFAAGVCIMLVGYILWYPEKEQ